MTHQTKHHFRVGWKFPKHKADVADYQAASLKDLLQLLEKSEGIAIRTTDYLYIHQVLPTGGIKEVIAHDQNNGAIQVDFTSTGKVEPGSSQLKEEHKVVNTVGDLLKRAAEASAKDALRKAKPRIKIKTKDVHKTPSKSSYFYVAYEAGHEH